MLCLTTCTANRLLYPFCPAPTSALLTVIFTNASLSLPPLPTSARAQCVRAIGQQAFNDLYRQLHANSRGNPLSSLSGPAIEALQRRIMASLLDQQQQQQEEGGGRSGGAGASLGGSVASGGAQQVMFHIRNLMAAEEGLKEVVADLQASRGSGASGNAGTRPTIDKTREMSHQQQQHQKQLSNDDDYGEDSDYAEDSFDVMDDAPEGGGGGGGGEDSSEDLVLQASLRRR